MTTGLSAGAVSVISGVLVEAVPWRDDTGRLSLVRQELQAGATLGFGAGHVHDVTNESDGHALSLHVYSPALTSMTFYEVAADQLVVRDVAGPPTAAASSSTPSSEPRAATGSAGGRCPVTRPQRRRSAGRRPGADPTGRARRARGAPRRGRTGGRHPARRPAGRRGRARFRPRRRAQRARVALRPDRRPRPARGHGATTSPSSWCARRATPRAWRRRRSASWGSPRPATWAAATRPGAAGVTWTPGPDDPGTTR